MTKQKAFTKEFEEEAVRLALTGGRMRREPADNLGVVIDLFSRRVVAKESGQGCR